MLFSLAQETLAESWDFVFKALRHFYYLNDHSGLLLGRWLFCHSPHSGCCFQSISSQTLSAAFVFLSKRIWRNLPELTHHQCIGPCSAESTTQFNFSLVTFIVFISAHRGHFAHMVVMAHLRNTGSKFAGDTGGKSASPIDPLARGLPLAFWCFPFSKLGSYCTYC